MKFGLHVVVLALGWLGVGCMPGSTAAGPALVHTHFPYAVTYDDAQKKSVLGPDWELENYRVRSTEADGTVQIERKDGYTRKYQFDFDNDDKGDATQELPSPDLVLNHRKTNATIEVASLLLDRRMGDKELRVLLNNTIDNDTGTRSLFVGFGKVRGSASKRFASRLLDSQTATLGTEKGLVATVERVDLDKLELDPKARWRRSRLFLMHLPFDYYVQEQGRLAGSAGGSGGDVEAAPKLHNYRVLLLVEYTNTPEDFEAQYPEFVRLLNKVHVLSDERLLSYLAKPFAACASEGAKKISLSLTVSGLGEGKVYASEGLSPMCTTNPLDTYRFGATGRARTLAANYDLAKPLDPAWLTEKGYVEERAVPAAAPAPAAPVAIPVPAPAGTAAAPVVPSAAAPGAPPASPQVPTGAGPASPPQATPP